MATVKAVCAVKDLAAAAFGQPFFVPSPAVAVRSFKDEVNRRADDNQMNAHPEDFEIYHLGDFDDSNGALIRLDEPVRLARAKDLIEAVG